MKSGHRCVKDLTKKLISTWTVSKPKTPKNKSQNYISLENVRGTYKLRILKWFSWIVNDLGMHCTSIHEILWDCSNRITTFHDILTWRHKPPSKSKKTVETPWSWAVYRCTLSQWWQLTGEKRRLRRKLIRKSRL